MTFRQMAVIKDVLENKTPVSVSMRNNGYSPKTAKTPKKLTKSDAWRQVMNEYLPDHKLFKKHEEALEATRWNDFTGEREEDHTIRLKAVDMAYKLKGHSMVNQGNNYQQVNISVDG